MEVRFNITKKRLAFAALLIVLVAIPSFVAGVSMSYSAAFKKGYREALEDISEQTGIEFEWVDLGNGAYEILAFYKGQMITVTSVEIHCWIYHFRDGHLLSAEHHTGTLTNIGKDWIEDQLGDSPATDPAKWISNSGTDTSGWTNQSSWTIIPDEINANGLTRAAGTYSSTGTGTWNTTHTFSVTGTQAVQTYGLNWVATAQSDNNLLCSDESSVKNCESGDTLKVTWQCSVT